jgi:Zn-dependent protease
MTHSLRLGTAFDIGIYVHWSFLLLPAWLVLTTWGIFGPSMVACLLLLLIAIFGCVVLHELGHALMARYFGIRTRDITLYPIGGVARLERMSERPWEEVLIALAGPAVNVVIAAVLIFVLALGGAFFSWPSLARSLPGGFLMGLLTANVFLVGFNLLPAFPMDGGRVLRALLSGPMGRLRATEIAAQLGAVIAVLLGAAAVVGMVRGIEGLANPMLLVVAGFVFLAGQQELMVLRRRETIRRLRPIDVLPADEAPVAPAPRLGFSGFVWDHRGRAWVLWQNGRPVASYGYPAE